MELHGINALPVENRSSAPCPITHSLSSSDFACVISFNLCASSMSPLHTAMDNNRIAFVSGDGRHWPGFRESIYQESGGSSKR